MAKLTPEQAAEKLTRRLTGATQDIAAGVARVTVAPGAQAAQKQDKMLQHLTEKVQDGTWARRVAAVSVEDWKKQMTEKGIGRISQGIQSARPKLVEFFGKLLPFQDSLQGSIKGMPDTTPEDSINRMVAWTRGMSKFRK